jgi:ketosteroid isomerase-like protein
MSSDGHVDTVGAIYEAFGRGDVPAILEALADDVVWEGWADNSAQRAGVPWMAERRGRDQVAGFFDVVGAWDVADFRLLSVMAGGDRVAAQVVIEATTAEGRRFRDEELHLWTFDAAGKVAHMRHYADTAKQMAAAGVSAVPAG